MPLDFGGGGAWMSNWGQFQTVDGGIKSLVVPDFLYLYNKETKLPALWKDLVHNKHNEEGPLGEENFGRMIANE